MTARTVEIDQGLMARLPAMAGASRASWLVLAFVAALLIPIQIFVGDVRLSVYRVVLLAVFFPAILRFVRDKTIRWRLADMLIIAFALQGGVALAATGGSVEAIGSNFLETLGPYFLARAFIRNTDQFVGTMRLFIICIAATIPFAIYEAFTQDPIILTVLGDFVPVLPNVPHEMRLGLDRSQVVFDHPILYGMFSAAGFGFALYVFNLRRSTAPGLLPGALVGIAAFLSLSSGAFVCVGIQVALFLYDLVLRQWRQRWVFLAASAVSLYTVLELASNRSMAQISISFLALNPSTAYTRIVVNEAAMDEVFKRPWFGMGLNTYWERPFWVVTESIDNFWIVMAFRNGLPSMILILLAVFFVVLSVVRARHSDPRIVACQTGFAITIVALSISIFTVHLWNSTYVLFMFLLGCAMWITDAPTDGTGPSGNTGSGSGPDATPPAAGRHGRGISHTPDRSRDIPFSRPGAALKHSRRGESPGQGRR